MGGGPAGLCPVRTVWVFREHVWTKNRTVRHAFFIKKFDFRKEPNSRLPRNCSKYSRTTNCLESAVIQSSRALVLTHYLSLVTAAFSFHGESIDLQLLQVFTVKTKKRSKDIFTGLFYLNDAVEQDMGWDVY